MATRTLVKLPPAAKAGDLVEITTLISHPMETGYRVDAEGRPLARDILRRFSCFFDAPGAASALVFSAELHPAISANPYLAFTLRATVSGRLRFVWEGDQGFKHAETATLVVT